MTRRLAVFLAVFLLVTTAAPARAAFTPSADYRKAEIEGFTVLVNPEVDKHAEEAKAAFAELERQLKCVCAAVAEKQLASLKKVKLWLEWNAKKNGAAEFHVSKGWLKDNGYNPDKVGTVEISNAKNFIDWSRRAQPWMILHELAHAYQFLVLGDRYPALEAAYKQAVERKLYESVDYVTGGKRKAYAITNQAEYFAELSEAYFGKNDFAPFTRDELEKHDPVGFALMRVAWGEPANAPPRRGPPLNPLTGRATAAQARR